MSIELSQNSVSTKTFLSDNSFNSFSFALNSLLNHSPSFLPSSLLYSLSCVELFTSVSAGKISVLLKIV